MCYPRNSRRGLPSEGELSATGRSCSCPKTVLPVLGCPSSVGHRSTTVTSSRLEPTRKSPKATMSYVHGHAASPTQMKLTSQIATRNMSAFDSSSAGKKPGSRLPRRLPRHVSPKERRVSLEDLLDSSFWNSNGDSDLEAGVCLELPMNDSSCVVAPLRPDKPAATRNVGMTAHGKTTAWWKDETLTPAPLFASSASAVIRSLRHNPQTTPNSTSTNRGGKRTRSLEETRRARMELNTLKAQVESWFDLNTPPNTLAAQVESWFKQYTSPVSSSMLSYSTIKPSRIPIPTSRVDAGSLTSKRERIGLANVAWELYTNLAEGRWDAGMSITSMQELGEEQENEICDDWVDLVASMQLASSPRSRSGSRLRSW